MTKIAGCGSKSQRHESADPDLYHNAMDPQHCLAGSETFRLDTGSIGRVNLFFLSIIIQYYIGLLISFEKSRHSVVLSNKGVRNSLDPRLRGDNFKDQQGNLRRWYGT
jgi:hypothetical protein